MVRASTMLDHGLYFFGLATLWVLALGLAAAALAQRNEIGSLHGLGALVARGPRLVAIVAFVNAVAAIGWPWWGS